MMVSDEGLTSAQVTDHSFRPLTRASTAKIINMKRTINRLRFPLLRSHKKIKMSRSDEKLLTLFQLELQVKKYCKGSIPSFILSQLELCKKADAGLKRQRCLH